MGELIKAIWGVELITGLVLGGISLAVCLLIGVVWAQTRDKPIPLAGVALTVATLLALPAAAEVPMALWVGLGLLGLAGVVVDIYPRLVTVSPLLVSPGAWLISSRAVDAGDVWVGWFLFASILLTAPLSARFAKHQGTGPSTPTIFALFAAGVFLSVPDTEEALILLGASLPMALLSAPRSPVRFGSAGACAAVGLAVWVIAEGGVGRPASIIGATACLGLLIADPVARLLVESRRTLLDRLPRGWPGLALISIAQGGAVWAVARTAGVAADATVASVLAVLLLSVVIATLRVAARNAAANGRRHLRRRTTREAGNSLD